MIERTVPGVARESAAVLSHSAMKERTLYLNNP